MANEIKEIYEKAKEITKNADFSTGFDDLDNFCKYLTGGEILTIGGRPAMGKTNFAISFINHLTDKGKNVLLFSLLMAYFLFLVLILDVLNQNGYLMLLEY